MTSTEKILASVSYFAIIGWLVVFVINVTRSVRSRFVSFHLRQSMGLLFVFLVARSVLAIIDVGFLNAVLILAFVVYWILGVVNSLQGEARYLPYVGKYFDSFLNFIE